MKKIYNYILNGIFFKTCIYTTQSASHQLVSSVNIILLADWPIAVNKVDMGRYQCFTFSPGSVRILVAD